MKCTRQSGAFGPGDAVQVRVQIGWGGSRPIKVSVFASPCFVVVLIHPAQLTRLDFVLRETLTFRCALTDGPGGELVLTDFDRTQTLLLPPTTLVQSSGLSLVLRASSPPTPASRLTQQTRPRVSEAPRTPGTQANPPRSTGVRRALPGGASLVRLDWSCSFRTLSRHCSDREGARLVAA